MCVVLKKLKQRITKILCINAIEEKEFSLIINISLQPRSLKNVNMSELKVEWYAN